MRVGHVLGGPRVWAGTSNGAMDIFEGGANLAGGDGNGQVTEALRYIGEPQADGSSHLIIHGKLFKLF